MIFSDTERDRRWGLTRDLLKNLELDAVLARGTPASDGQGHYRWLSLYAPLSADGAVVIHADDQALFVHDGAQSMYASRVSWFTQPVIAPGSIGEVVAWLAGHGVRRLGVADLDALPHGWVTELLERLPNLMLVDVGAAMLRLRTAKSVEELAVMAQSAALADLAWDSVRESLRPGRKEHEVLAEAEMILRTHGCDGNFNLVMHLQQDFTGFDRQPSDRPICAGDSFLLEISPRLAGYYTQLTNVVSMGPPREELVGAFEAANAARSYAAGHLRPGANAREVGQSIASFLEKRGFTSAPSFGHMLGLELEEPRLGTSSYEFVEDSVLVFHPVVATTNYPVVLRGDTYRITDNGPLRLNTLAETITQI